MRMWQRLKILRTCNLHPSRGGNLNTYNFFAVSHLRHLWSRHPGHCLRISGSIEHLPELLQVAPVFLSGTRLVWSLVVICLVMDYLDSSKTELQACKKTRQGNVPPEESPTWIAGDCSEVKTWKTTSSKKKISNPKWDSQIQNENLKSKMRISNPKWESQIQNGTNKFQNENLKFQNENLKAKMIYWGIEIFVWVCGRVRMSGVPFHERIIKMRISIRIKGQRLNKPASPTGSKETKLKMPSPKITPHQLRLFTRIEDSETTYRVLLENHCTVWDFTQHRVR